MRQYINVSAEQPVQSQPAAENLCQIIEHLVEKQPGEEVKSVRVFGNNYRCNWWVRDLACSGMFQLATGRIRRSRFLRATRTDDKVTIEDLTGHGG
jgi:hypothetical protein